MSSTYGKTAVVFLLVCTLAAGLLLSFDTDGVEFEQPSNTSVIFVAMDVLRADHMQCYGYERNTAPFICEFGRKNILFKDAISQATWTLPAETSVFTSQYPSVHGVYTSEDRIESSKILMPEALPHNYSKAAFVGGAHVKERFGFDQGFDKYYSADSFSGFNKTMPKALKWLSRHRNESFFLFVHGYDMHSPYTVPEPYSGIYTENYTGILRNYEISSGVKWYDTLGKVKRYPNGSYFMTVNSTNIILEKKDIEYITGRYDEQIRYADSMFQSFIEELKRRGLYRSTVIVVYSSHGESLNDHTFPGYHLSGHGKLPFREQIKVPLIMHVPGVKNKTVEGPVELIDLYPTVLDLLDIEHGPQVQGESLVNEIKTGMSEGPVFSEAPKFYSQAVVTSKWKYIRGNTVLTVPGPDSPKLLYRRSGESGRRNLYYKYSEVAETMESYLKNWRLSNIRLTTGD